MEFFDIRNPDGTVTGIIKERDLVHRDGDLHGTVHIFIVRQGLEGPELLLQKRSACKDSFPGCYDISSAGHLSAGQDYPEAALRELEEELGIRALMEDLLFIGYHEGYSQASFHGRPFCNHEISAVYLYRKEVDIGTLTLQEEEVESVCWLPYDLCMEKAVCGDESYCLFADELKMLEAYIR